MEALAISRANPISCAGLAPDSLMWYPQTETGLQRGRVVMEDSMGCRSVLQRPAPGRSRPRGRSSPRGRRFRGVALTPAYVETVLFGHGLVHGQHDARNGVDRESRANLVQGNAREPTRVTERIHCHAYPAHLAFHHRIVGVVPHLGREVERNVEAGLTMGNQKLETLVGLCRAPEP